MFLAARTQKSYALRPRSRITACAIKMFAAGALLALSAGTLAFAARLPSGHLAPDLDCTYDSRTDHDMHTFKSCAWVDPDGHLHVTPGHLHRLSYDRRGLATIRIGQWYGAAAAARPL